MDSSKEILLGFIKGTNSYKKQMMPIGYLIVFIAPMIFLFSYQKIIFFQTYIPNLFVQIIGYTPIIAVFLFTENAYYLLNKNFSIPKPKYNFLLVIPLINMFYQFKTVLPLGSRIRKVLSLNDHPDHGFKGILSEVYCYLFIALNIAIQINIHLLLTNKQLSYKMNTIEWTIRGIWIYATSLMFWDYSKIINNVLLRKQ